MIKSLSKAVMRRSSLENTFSKENTLENKRYKNYCSKLYKNVEKQYYTNLNLKEETPGFKTWDLAVTRL